MDINDKFIKDISNRESILNENFSITFFIKHQKTIYKQLTYQIEKSLTFEGLPHMSMHTHKSIYISIIAM